MMEEDSGKTEKGIPDKDKDTALEGMGTKSTPSNLLLNGLAETVEMETKETPDNMLQYNITDTPPLVLTLLCAVQACIQIVSLSLTSALLVTEAVCGTPHLTAQLMSSSMFLSGLTTFIQCTVGVRLPVFQGPTFHWIVPVLARAELEDWACLPEGTVNGTNLNQGANSTTPALDWQFKLSEISGVLMVVSIMHAIIGVLGLGGLITRVIGPLTVAPAVTVMILQLSNKLLNFTLIQLGVSGFTLCLTVVCTTYMSNVLIPVPSWSPKGGFRLEKSTFIRTYAVIISLAVGWLFSYILTVTNVFSDDPDTMEYQARTDNKWDTVELAQWFYVPYPGQFGLPRFSVALFFGLFVAMLSSVIDSVADYNIVSRLCFLPKVPSHATNRGLLTEGFCSMLSGLFGIGHATSTYVAVTGSLAITGVTSLRVFQFAGVMLMFVGVVGKIGAFLVTIPKPVIGAVIIVVLASVIGVLLSGLSEVDMKRPRNCMTVGLAILMGTMVPKLIVEHQDIVNTGVTELDQAIKAICGTPLFVAGVVACFLDNTLPGGRGEKEMEDNSEVDVGYTHEAFKLPYLHKYFINSRWTKYCPFLPGFQKY